MQTARGLNLPSTLHTSFYQASVTNMGRSRRSRPQGAPPGATQAAQRRNEALWQRIKRSVQERAVEGTAAGQWSARKAQLAVKMYKANGGGYYGPRNSNNSLVRWGAQRWRTKSGLPSHITGERYLPEKAIQALSPRDYAATTRSKRASMARGQQFSRQPKSVARIVKAFRTK